MFDFELEGSPSPSDSDNRGISPPPVYPTISRTRNMVEASLSNTFAADAPSHRAAWKRIEQKGHGSIYAFMRRGSTQSDEEDGIDERAISNLASSLPMEIALSRKKPKPPVPMERKTSLTERAGKLVPSLRGAMKGRDIPEHSLDLGDDDPNERSPARVTRNDGSRKKGSRSASVSREREGVKSYAADPGAVFESLVDEDDDDGDEELDGQAGTLRDSRQFVPPHVLARKESLVSG